MIVSIHIPKTAGTSFRSGLIQAVGPRLHLDYGDWPEISTPAARTHNAKRREQALTQAPELESARDVIHGHFVATKYAGAFVRTNLVTFVREPVQQTISAFHQALRSQPGWNADHPGILMVQKAGMDLVEFAQTFSDHQSLYFAGLGLDAFDMVGITEHYSRSVALFSRRFGLKVNMTDRENVDPEGRTRHEVAPSVRQAIQRSRELDIEIYRRACERFASEAAKQEI